MKSQNGIYWMQRALVVMLITLTLLSHQIVVNSRPIVERSQGPTFLQKEINYPHDTDSDHKLEGTGLVVPEKRGRKSWG
ncbi:hypothetical protein P879_00525 [Paragonimus westermani]|uniref:Uncharacterized protein n=1 Tax=Paragonimus westermani TaxID=34504 RepID=A0A8T0DMZ1_9TREM|nr:hypothetical protein P879_00525 [Paragonimus westermani]